MHKIRACQGSGVKKISKKDHTELNISPKFNAHIYVQPVTIPGTN